MKQAIKSSTAMVLLACVVTGCSAINPIKDADISNMSSIKDVQKVVQSPKSVRWGGEVTAIEYLGKDSLIHLQVTEEVQFTRPSPANGQDSQVKVIVVTPNMDARANYRTGELVTLLGQAQLGKRQADNEQLVETIWVMPDAIYSWLDMRDNREYDPTGIIAMSNLDNQPLERFVDSPWKSQDETDPMMQRQPIYKQPQNKNARLVIFTE